MLRSGNKSNNGNKWFLYIYCFLDGAAAHDCRCYNVPIFHSLAEMPQTAPEKFWLWQIYGIFYGIIDLSKNKIYLNQYDMLSFRERPCRF